MNKKNKSKLTRVALYIRVSTDRQAKEGDSLEAQEKALRDYAKEHNFEIVGTYMDDGESGQKIKRTNLQKLLSDTNDGKIDLIIMTKLDRWFRNVSDFYKVIDILKQNKVDWKTIWEDYDTTTASGEFWLNMSLALGQMEAKRTGERICEVFDHKYKFQKTVCTGAKIFGYDISKDKKLIINKEEAEQLNLLFDKYIQTNNLNETTRWFQNNIKKRSSASVRLYLTNTAYIGKYKHKIKNTNEIEIIEDFSPIIINEDKFNKVQKMLQKNVKEYKRQNSKNGNKTDYIFSGLLYCSCGKKLAGKHSKGNHYYICKRALTTICNNKIHLSEISLEKYLIENIMILIENKINEVEVNNISNINKNIDKNKEINKIKNKLNKLTNLYLEDMIDIEIYKNEYPALKQKLEELENKKIEIKDFSKLKKFLKNTKWQKLYDNLENKEKRKLWSSIINKITFKSKTDFEIEFNLY